MKELPFSSKSSGIKLIVVKKILILRRCKLEGESVIKQRNDGISGVASFLGGTVPPTTKRRISGKLPPPKTA